MKFSGVPKVHKPQTLLNGLIILISFSVGFSSQFFTGLTNVSCGLKLAVSLVHLRDSPC